MLSSSRKRQMRSTARPLSATTDSPTMAVTPAICFARIPRRIGDAQVEGGLQTALVTRNSLVVRNGFFLLARPAAELVQLVVERLQADAEDFGGARLVVARVLEGHQDQPVLGLFH